MRHSGAALCLAVAAALAAAATAQAAPEGHCMAAAPQGGCVAGPVRDLTGALLPGVHAYYSAPTERYAHAVLGDGVEWGALVYVIRSDAGTAETGTVVLPDDRVFEDLAPRLVDLDGDGQLEVVVVESDSRRGAALKVYGLRDDAFGLLAATPPIGQRFRWLAPLGAADLDGDGRMEIAYIDRPHLARTLRVWRFADGALTEVAALRGLTNHKIGEPFISGGIRDCGDGPEIITADAGWRQIVATRLTGGELDARAIAPFEGPPSFAPILACEG